MTETSKNLVDEIKRFLLQQKAEPVDLFRNIKIVMKENMKVTMTWQRHDSVTKRKMAHVMKTQSRSRPEK